MKAPHDQPSGFGDGPGVSPSKSEGARRGTSRWTEKLFLNFAAAGAFGDERLTPAVFQELAKTFNTSMTQLGVPLVKAGMDVWRGAHEHCPC